MPVRWAPWDPGFRPLLWVWTTAAPCSPCSPCSPCPADRGAFKHKFCHCANLVLGKQREDTLISGNDAVVH